MSEQNTSNPKTIATGTKEKDPRRVAAGKRLGAMSKKAKEEKRLERERQAQAQVQQIAEMEADNNKTLYFVGGLVVVGVAYYSCIPKQRQGNGNAIANANQQ